MPNPHIEQLHRKSQSCTRITRISLAVTVFFAALTEKLFDGPWAFLTGALAFLVGCATLGGFAEQWTYRRELRNLQMIDEQNVHGNPSPFVETPPANPEPSDDNFWSQR